MACKTDSNDSLDISFKESDWLSSTPNSLRRSDTKFYTAFDETFESEYSSIRSSFFTNNENSCSTIGIKETSNGSDSELILSDHETEKELYDNKKNIDFDEHSLVLRKYTSLNIEDFSENNVNEKSLAKEKILSDGRTVFKSFKFKENSLSEHTNEKSVYHKSADKHIENFDEECALKEDASNDKYSNNILTSNLTDLGRFHGSSTPLNISLNLQRKVSQSNHTSPRSSPSFLHKTFEPESLQQIAIKSWDPFDSKVITCRTFQNEDFQHMFKTQIFKKDHSCFSSASSVEDVAEVQHDPATERKDESSRENSVTMRENDVLASKDSSFELKKNITSNLCPINFDSKDSDLKIVKTKDHRPSVDSILGLFNIDNSLSKNILLAILSRSISNGASYARIIKFLRSKRVFSTKLTASIKIFLQTAVKANILKIKKNRYFLVSRVGAVAGQFLETDEDKWNRKSKNDLNKKQDFSIRTKSKIPAEEEFYEVTSSNNNPVEIINDGKDSKIAIDYRPNVDKILNLFNCNNNLSKNILLAILSENFIEGVTYTKIIKYLRNKHIFSTKLTECVKRFLQTAVNADILKMKRKRYFLVSREVAQFVQMNSDEWNINSSNGFTERKGLPSRTKSKLRCYGKKKKNS